jgi:hypothetical protein
MWRNSSGGLSGSPGFAVQRKRWSQRPSRPLAGIVLAVLILQASGCASAHRPAASPPTVGTSGEGSVNSAMPSAVPSNSSSRPTAGGPDTRPIRKAGGNRSPDSTAARTAATRYGWTNLVARDDFDGSYLRSSWRPYDSAGHAGNGIRSPRQISLRNGVLHMTGTRDGATAGMDWKYAQRYGRWEIRARFPAGCGCYHPVLILWPADRPWPAGGEIDYAEVTDPARRRVKFFLHYGADNRQLEASRQLDMTEWHNFAVEWTPYHVTGYVDGQTFFHTERRDVLPPGPMRQTVQLDWFPDSGRGDAIIEVDWATMYRL